MIAHEVREELAAKIAEKISAPMKCGQLPIDVARRAVEAFYDAHVERTEADTTTLGDPELTFLWTDWLVVRVPVASGRRTEARPWRGRPA